MKTIIRSIFIAAVLCMVSGNIQAQSLKDLLNKAKNSSALKEAVENVTGVEIAVKPEITGNYTYSGVAVKLESDDLIKNAAASVAATQIEDKLDETLAKIGVKSGMFNFRFSSDSTFTTTFKAKEFTGKYSVSENGKNISLTYGKNISLKPFTATLSVNGDITELLFDTDRLLELIGKLTANSSNSAFSTINAIASQYDGMKSGLELKKI